ncbi:hypothetical protein [Deinococcus sp. Leaf326]|jgi:hypothetical protein|uniref:hypothetical protein n=1 Tax=Deinococcus sp. Leaf326 TaxID=1736338 RepID=UPI0006FDA25E|nr:hypothetical protein [Deinococcus sp. Leaf326]KQR27811.1 hypothetical protein ASF71_04185 [Deinococcus sp. Leaf326]
MPTDIQTTIDALSGDLSKLDAGDGAALIESWLSDLENADWRGAKTLHADLVSLRHQLDSDAPDAGRISDLLVKLGESAERAAPDGGQVGEQVTKLASTLMDAGKRLA